MTDHWSCADPQADRISDPQRLEAAEVFRLRLIGRLAEKSREGPGGSDGVGLRSGDEMADRHVLDHAKG
jgi:hypothetical protein